MSLWFAHYAAAYPMAPLGGLFILPVSLCILLGAALPGQRTRLVWLGFALGSTAIVLFGSRMAHHAAPVRPVQTASVAVAIALEFMAFALVMPRLSNRSGRGALLATLIIVSAHFLIMTPAFGPLIAVLGLLGLANAAAGWRQPQRSAARLWLIDGGLKFVGAALLLAVSPGVDIAAR